MRRSLIALLLAASLSAHASEVVSPAEAAAIGDVIAGQIAAFRHDDAAAAYGYATPGIQGKFGDAAHFLQAVRQAYPQVYRPRSFKLLGQSRTGATVTQRVEIVGPDGRLVTAIYDMVREADGAWRIDECRLEDEKLQET